MASVFVDFACDLRLTLTIAVDVNECDSVAKVLSVKKAYDFDLFGGRASDDERVSCPYDDNNE